MDAISVSAAFSEYICLQTTYPNLFNEDQNTFLKFAYDSKYLDFVKTSKKPLHNIILCNLFADIQNCQKLAPNGKWLEFLKKHHILVLNVNLCLVITTPENMDILSNFSSLSTIDEYFINSISKSSYKYNILNLCKVANANVDKFLEKINCYGKHYPFFFSFK